MRIIGEPNTTATLNFKTVGSTLSILKVSIYFKKLYLFVLLQDLNIHLDLDVEIEFIDCEFGDLFNNVTKS